MIARVELGIRRDELLTMTPRLFFRMLHRAKLKRFRDSLGVANLTALVANAFSGKTSRGYHPHDFMLDVPHSMRATREKQKQKDIFEKAMALAARFGGKVTQGVADGVNGS